MIKFNRIWAMPSRWTFTIKPIRELIAEEVLPNTVWCDPFAGQHSFATITNDLNPKAPAKFHMDALDFLKTQPEGFFDGVVFDPPYSPRQVKECYDGVGLKLTIDKVQQSFWAQCKNELTRILKTGGKAICCGWNSNGMGKCRGYELQRILMVPHGGNKNDTIVTIEVKIAEKP